MFLLASHGHLCQALIPLLNHQDPNLSNLNRHFGNFQLQNVYKIDIPPLSDISTIEIYLAEGTVSKIWRCARVSRSKSLKTCFFLAAGVAVAPAAY
jgi:hypothetical protein